MKPQAKEYKATKNQVTAIHTLKSKLGLSEEVYISILASYNVKSSKDLLFHEAGELITNLSARLNGKRPTPITKKYYGKGKRDKDNPDVTNLTQLQAERILILEKKLGWSNKDTYKFIHRQTGKNAAVPMLTISDAGIVIVGMQKVLSGKIGFDYADINIKTNTQLQELKC